MSAATTTAPNSNLFGMISPTTTQPTYTNQNQTSLFGGATSPPMRPTTMSPTSPPMRTNSTPAMAPTTSLSTALGAAKPKSSGNFDDLWSMSLGSSASNNKPVASGTGANKSIKDLEKEKAQAGIWGSGLQSQQQRPGGGPGAFGNFGGGSFGGPGVASSSGGGDDLLL